MNPRYTIEIKHGTHQHFSLWLTKNYGDYRSETGGYNSVEECLIRIKEYVNGVWKEFDSIAGRKPDPVTIQNTHFESVTDKVTLSLVLGGQQSLSAFEVAR